MGLHYQNCRGRGQEEAAAADACWLLVLDSPPAAATSQRSFLSQQQAIAASDRDLTGQLLLLPCRLDHIEKIETTKRKKVPRIKSQQERQLPFKKGAGTMNPPSCGKNHDVVAAWRLDPEGRLSDFQIRIRGVPSGIVSIYHVHKVFLALGPWKCEYFAGLFREGGNFSEKCEAELEFDDEAARAFPYFLDYVYTGKLIDRYSSPGSDTDSVESVAETAIALIQLGNYFHAQPSLVEQAGKIAAENLCRGNLQESLPLITKYKKTEGMGSIYEVAKALVIQSVFDENAAPRPLEEIIAAADCMDIEFVLSVMRLCNDLATGRSLVLQTPDDSDCFPGSIIAAKFLVSLRDSLSRSEFERLTSEELLPRLPSATPEVALQLLDVEAQYLQPDDEMSSLQKRCLDALLPIEAAGHSPDTLTAAVQALFWKIPNLKTAGLFAYSLQRTARKRRREEAGNDDTPDHHIKILSAFPGVRGSYKLTRSSLATEFYQKKGSWNGKPAVFYIYIPSGKQAWSIAVSVDLQAEIALILYEHPVPNLKRPPAWGWVQIEVSKRRDGVFPPVLLQFCEGDVVLDE